MLDFKSQRNAKRKEEIFFPHQIYITWKYIFYIVSWQINRLLLSSQGLIEWGRISEGSFFF